MIREQVKIYFSILVVLILSLIYLSWSNYKQESEIANLKKNRYEFFVLVNSLKFNHNDFNYLVNRYIVNDNENYFELMEPFIGVSSNADIDKLRYQVKEKREFSIKNVSIYDLNSENFNQFFIKLGLTPEIFEKIKRAQELSVAVLKLDIEALNSYYGLTKDEQGNYSVKVEANKQKAIEILYSPEYRKYNQEIQKIVMETERHIHTSMTQKIDKKREVEKIYEMILTILFFLIFLMILLGIIYSINKIVMPLNELLKWTKLVENGEYKLDTNAITVKNEIGLLMHSFSSMAKKVQDDIQLLEKMSLTDQLTQLYNRRALDNRLDEIYNSYERYKTTFSLMIVDIDFFKKVNDTYGHDVGDSVLKEFATILRKGVRQVDIVGRWGGEEFLVICPETNHEGAKVVAENLRKTIESYSFTTVGHKTASLGTAEIQEGMTLAQVIEKADEALYFAKENGRNQVA